MKILIDDELYNLEINKKNTTKNLYIRVKDDLTIYVTCSTFTTDKKINKIIDENISSIRKMIKQAKSKQEFKNSFYYLGKKYDIVHINNKDVFFGENKVFMNKNIDIDKYLKKQANIVFKEQLDKMYASFTRSIPYPTLTIRKMTTRWGVCNTKDKRVTLNLELIKKNIECLDYVIIHELSHLIYPNHSSKFWTLVEENYPEYKKIRKQMKEY